MALKISKNSGLTDIVSSDNSNPIVSQHPLNGSSVTVQLWLYNDNATERFENISIQATDSVSTSEASWISLSSDGTNFGAGGTSLTMANISDSNVGKPFWAKITTPSVGSVQNKSDIKLTVNFRKFAV